MQKTIISSVIIICITILAAVYLLSKNEKDKPSPTKVGTRLSGSVVSGGASPRSSAEKQAINARDGKPQSTLTPELAKAKLDDYFSKENNLPKRTAFACDLLEELSFAGFPNEAAQLLDPDAGMLRSNEIAALFASSNTSTGDLLKRINEVCKFQGEKEKAIKGYFLGLKLSQFKESLSNPEFQQALSQGEQITPARLSASLAYAMGIKKANGLNGGDPDFLETAQTLIENRSLSPSDYVEMINNYSPEDPFERWKQVQQVMPKENPGQDLIVQMVLANPAQALNSILDSQNSQGLDYAISTWSGSDPGGLSRWYGSNSKQFTPTQNDSVRTAFSNTAVESGDYELARTWAGSLTNPESRNQLLEKITESEDKMHADQANAEKREEERRNKK